MTKGLLVHPDVLAQYHERAIQLHELCAALAALEADMRAPSSISSGTMLGTEAGTPMLDDAGRAVERTYWADRLAQIRKDHAP